MTAPTDGPSRCVRVAERCVTAPPRRTARRHYRGRLSPAAVPPLHPSPWWERPSPHRRSRSYEQRDGSQRSRRGGRFVGGLRARPLRAAHTAGRRRGCGECGRTPTPYRPRTDPDLRSAPALISLRSLTPFPVPNLILDPAPFSTPLLSPSPALNPSPSPTSSPSPTPALSHFSALTLSTISSPTSAPSLSPSPIPTLFPSSVPSPTPSPPSSALFQSSAPILFPSLTVPSHLQPQHCPRPHLQPRPHQHSPTPQPQSYPRPQPQP